MKFIYLIFITAFSFSISCNNTTKNNNEPSLGDTIQTASGLQYFYIKKGQGRKVEKGCEVSVYLSLMVNDSVVWNTNEAPDSLFTYIAEFTRLIEGFNEITLLLQQGDELVAILPDSIAYGAKGAGDVVPPYATLVYDKFKVVNVEAPKAILADTLLKILEKEGFDAMTKKHELVTTTKDSLNYHLGKDQIYGLWYKLTDTEKHEEAIHTATYFAQKIGDNMLRYYLVRSLENQNKIKPAIDSLKILIADEPDNEVMINKMKALQEKLEAME